MHSYIAIMPLQLSYVLNEEGGVIKKKLILNCRARSKKEDVSPKVLFLPLYSRNEEKHNIFL